MIVDENKKAYKVDQIVMMIWSMCDGNRTQEQIVDELVQKTKLEKAKISEAVSDVMAKLEQIGLVQKSQ